MAVAFQVHPQARRRDAPLRNAREQREGVSGQDFLVVSVMRRQFLQCLSWRLAATQQQAEQQGASQE
ncbi:hypothetical protein D9M71_836800 [compost metagenome]